MTAGPPLPSAHAQRVLELLRDHRNVILLGPPGTGKSTLLAEVGLLFEATAGLAGGPPKYAPGRVPFPPHTTPALPTWMPSPARGDRKVFSTTFDQTTVYRDFMRGVAARVNGPASGVALQVTKGTLYRANEHAKEKDGASLVIVDEINRGPAVKIFGSTIAAIEGDKRLGPDGQKVLGRTLEFELLDDEGKQQPYALAHDLYLLAVMNLADASVEPLDAAFLRRFVPYRLEPDRGVLLDHFGLSSLPAALPDPAVTAGDVYAAVVLAWEAVNGRLALGRGDDFRMGHGVFLGSNVPVPGVGDPMEAGVAYVRAGWDRLMGHIDEMFYGNVAGVAAALNVGGSSTVKHPFRLERTTFAGQSVSRLVRSPLDDSQDFYRLLRAVAAPSHP